MPLWRSAGSTVAKITYQRAWLALVMKHLVPFRTQSSPFCAARVCMPATSLPAAGSVVAYEHSPNSLVMQPEVLLLLLLGAAERHRGARRRTHERRADARAAPPELLLDQAARQIVEAGTAVGLLDVRVHEAHFPGLLDDLLGEAPVLVVLPCDGADLLLREVVRELANVLLLVGEGEVDH